MADCDNRCLPGSEQFPDGLCTVSCLDDSDCPADSACVDTEGGVCLFTCPTVDNDESCAFLGPLWRCSLEDRQADEGEVSVCIGED